jgi:hypothetical protein
MSSSKFEKPRTTVSENSAIWGLQSRNLLEDLLRQPVCKHALELV